MAVAKSLDSRKRPALKRRAKQQRPVNRPEKARRASLFTPTVYRRAFAAAEELTLQQPYGSGMAITKSLDKTKTRRSEERRPFFSSLHRVPNQAKSSGSRVQTDFRIAV
jgi:hypothetical protein